MVLTLIFMGGGYMPPLWFFGPETQPSKIRIAISYNDPLRFYTVQL